MCCGIQHDAGYLNTPVALLVFNSTSPTEPKPPSPERAGAGSVPSTLLMTAMPDPSTASKEGMPPVYTCTHVVLMAQCLWHGLDSMAIIVSTCFVRNVVSLQLELRINCCLL